MASNDSLKNLTVQLLWDAGYISGSVLSPQPQNMAQLIQFIEAFPAEQPIAMDQIPETFEANSQIRKLSITINLNDDYEGGEFYIDAEEQYGETSPRLVDTLKPKGSISVFPSDIWHKVDPVTKGTRYSIVVWVKGDPFK